MQSSDELLASDGPLAHYIKDFSPRPQQQAMAAAVEEALANHDVLVTEAGTGTGKTFAYLVPALLSGSKVIISTGTRHLQDQLYHRDLPVVRKALGMPVDTALLKGRANYLCLHRMQLGEQQGRFQSRAIAAQFVAVRDWAARTQHGDIAELADIPEDAPIWPQVTSTTDNCLGQECGQYSECYVMKARRRAQEAEVVVVNHHLLFADMVLREEGFGEVLPGANAFILDEAHQLPEVATRFFGQSLSSRQFQELAGDTVNEQLREAADLPELRELAEDTGKAAVDLRLAFGRGERRGTWEALRDSGTMRAALDSLEQALEILETALRSAAQRGRGLESCLRRSTVLREQLALISGPQVEQHVRWFETSARGFMIHVTPMDIAEPFQRTVYEQQRAWIFTSATLAVGDSFEFFTSRLGLYDTLTRLWESPFDFEQQALLYHPADLPDPNTEGYTGAVIEAALPVLEASGGRAFLLFTSHRALNEAAGLLGDRLDYPLLVQGSAPRTELLDQFRHLGNAVLLGTSSFWEGVDVRGAALSCVIIDRLPFASPDDPVLQARISALRESGANPFMEYQLPNAVIALKQGAGRLIRDVHDRGVLMLCDPRLGSRAYGRTFLASLPPMRRTRDPDDVRAFFRRAV